MSSECRNPQWDCLGKVADTWPRGLSKNRTAAEFCAAASKLCAERTGVTGRRAKDVTPWESVCFSPPLGTFVKKEKGRGQNQMC